MRTLVLVATTLLASGCAAPRVFSTSSPKPAASAKPMTAEAIEVLGVLQRVARGEPAALGGDRTVVVTARKPSLEQWQTVAFDIAGAHADYLYRMGGARASGLAEVDCAAGRARMRSVSVDGAGTVMADAAGGRWTQPEPGSTLGVLVERACPRLPLAPTSMIAQAPPQVQPGPSQAPFAASSPAPAQAAAAGLKPPIDAVVQIGAFQNPDGARTAARAVGDRHPAVKRRVGVEAVVVRGVRMFRAYIGGFTRRADAQGLCRDLKARRQDCFVRAGT